MICARLDSLSWWWHPSVLALSGKLRIAHRNAALPMEAPTKEEDTREPFGRCAVHLRTLVSESDLQRCAREVRTFQKR